MSKTTKMEESNEIRFDKGDQHIGIGHCTLLTFELSSDYLFCGFKYWFI